jgi:cysteinyl-tRNA synthetase
MKSEDEVKRKLALLRIYNTMSGEVEPFKPRGGPKIKMYTCGPSTYRRPHTGNYRTFLFEDILQRYLEYSGFVVVRLITLTDVEDKTLTEAKERKISVDKLTQKNEEVFFRDAELLKMKKFNFIARSSTSVDQAVELIKTLLKKGYAYPHVHEGRINYYFNPLRFQDFGKLAKIDLTEWPVKKRRYHKDTYPGLRWNKGDFILWHGYREGDKVHWNTEIGEGRPAWNIQDTAMVTKHLGFRIDVACGGVDNLVRHHDYNIAVTEAISEKNFSSYWMHGEHLFVDGKKMSKSRGNVIYPNDLIEKGYTGEQIRFFLIYGHYRKRLNFTWKEFERAIKKLKSFRKIVNELKKTETKQSSKKAVTIIRNLFMNFEKNMNNDLNVKTAFDQLISEFSKLNTIRKNGELSSKDASTAFANLQKVDGVLQVIF